MLRRKQIQLTERQAAAIRREATRRRLSDAAVIRELLESWMRERTQENLKARYERALGVVGRFRGDGAHVARDHDRYLEDAYRS